MSVVFDRDCPYFQFPQTILTTGQLRDMSESETKLYVSLLFKAQKHTKVDLELSNDEIKELAGLSTNSIAAARGALVERGLIQAKRIRGGIYRHTLCHPDTGSPLPKPNRRQTGVAEARTDNDSPGLSPRGRRQGRNIADLTPEEYRGYFEARLPKQEFPVNKGWVAALCPFHPDMHSSLSVNVNAGTWRCHGCDIGGGIIAFEQKISNCDTMTAITNIAELTGARDILSSTRRSHRVAEMGYPYVDEHGQVLYFVHRFPGKQFGVSAHVGNNRWKSNMKGVRRILYHLPQVLAANVVIVTEGEKDTDRVSELGLLAADESPVAVTTNPFGAGNWKDEYSSYLKGKKVIILADTDDKGIEHGHSVRESISRHSSEVRLVAFSVSELGENGKDVSDYLETHTGEQLVEKMGKDWFQVTSVPVVIEI